MLAAVIVLAVALAAVLAAVAYIAVKVGGFVRNGDR